MKKEYKNINRLFNVVSRALFRINSTLDYSRTIEAISRLAEVIHSTETEEDVWWIGECSDATLDSIIVGAYWFVNDFCSDDPIKYQRIALNLIDVFKPGCTTGPEPESSEQDVYDALEQMYNKYKAVIKKEHLEVEFESIKVRADAFDLTLGKYGNSYYLQEFDDTVPLILDTDLEHITLFFGGYVKGIRSRNKDVKVEGRVSD